ncbi:hypothetical protein [Micromonospora sp. SH-82]|uniref:hypothetical protein n=1 Tax=Micromonospora sp. SH-82 TaxID=3132938 RepID=UPI003EBA1C41
MDATGMQARRFPLVPRPRPACIPLPQRVADLEHRAATAIRHHDTAAAASVFNLAALLASDCGLPDLARQWSVRFARTTLARPAQDFRSASHSLEPVINLARLRARAGDGDQAWQILEDLYKAISTRTDTVVDGVDIPGSRLTAESTQHRELRQWLWAVLLSSGSRALAASGRWDDARHRVDQHHGIGNRMLDGRQIAVIAHATAGRHDRALELVQHTEPGEPWEQAITACLALTCQQTSTPIERENALLAYQGLDRAVSGLAVFHTRLGLTLVETLGGTHHPATHYVLGGLARSAIDDGYAARDLLSDPRCRSAISEPQVDELSELVNACGLDRGFMPNPLLMRLEETLDATERIVAGETPPTRDRLIHSYGLLRA